MGKTENEACSLGKIVMFFYVQSSTILTFIVLEVAVVQLVS